MKNTDLGRIIKSIVGGLGAFALAIFLKMPLVMIILLPIVSYGGIYMVTKPDIKIGSIKITNANGEEMKALMEDAYEDLEVLHRAAKNLDDKEIRALAEGLYKSGVSIFDHLQANPSKISLARRFINYYLDTAAGLVDKYQRLNSSKVRGESVAKARDDVVGGLGVLTKAFDKQFERLMQGEIMDITTDVKVLEQTFRSEE